MISNGSEGRWAMTTLKIMGIAGRLGFLVTHAGGTLLIVTLVGWALPEVKPTNALGESIVRLDLLFLFTAALLLATGIYLLARDLRSRNAPWRSLFRREPTIVWSAPFSRISIGFMLFIVAVPVTFCILRNAVRSGVDLGSWWLVWLLGSVAVLGSAALVIMDRLPEPNFPDHRRVP
jgi:hypothetical protein